MKDDRFDYYEQEQYENGNVYKEHKLTDAERKSIKVKGVIGIILMVIGGLLFMSNFFLGPLTFGKGGDFMMIYMPATAISGMILLSVGFFLASPLITKKTTQFTKKIQLYNKEELSDVSDIGAEIKEDATRRTGRAFKQGINDADASSSSEQKFCSSCGQKISKSSKFCSHCGAEQ